MSFFGKNTKPGLVAGIFLFAVFSACPSVSKADLPLTIEALITDKGKVKLDASITYVNSDRLGMATGEPIAIQTGSTSFITLPTAIGETRGNNDTLVASLGLRYGLTDETEIYGRGAMLYTSSRGKDLSGPYNDSETRFSDAWAGANVRFKEDDQTAAVLGFAELALCEKHRKSEAFFKSWMLGLTTYRAIDPMVLSLTAAYQFNHPRKDGEEHYNPGNLMLINPSSAFAVNDRITLSTGLQWTNRRADRRNGERLGFRRTRTDLLLGLGYGISKEGTLNLTLKGNVSGREGADLRLNWLHAF